MENDSITFERIGNSWLFSDGTVLPVVSGGDETAGAPGATQGGATQGGAGGVPDPSGNGGGAGGQGGSGDDSYSLAAGFLGRVPEEHRSILEPYVKQWDAGVTRRFQELNSQYAPYQELGDIEEVQAAVNLAQMLNENPYQVYGILHQALINGEIQAPQGQQQQQQVPPQQQQLLDQQQQQQQQGQMPQEFQQKFSALENAVMAIGQHLLGQTQQTQQEQEDSQLTEYLEGLHTEFGDFDEDFVLTRMLRGEDPEQAIQAFNDVITQRATQQMQRNSGLPKLLGGGGGPPPGDQTSVKDLSRKDTQNLVASVLQNARSQGQ